MKVTAFAGSLVLAGIMLAGNAVAAAQGDNMAQRMGEQSQNGDTTETMEQTRDREQVRTEDGSGEQYRYQHRNEERKQNGEPEMEMNGNGMGGSRMGGGAGRH